MAALAEPKACRSCAGAKRRCGKERPACRRCRARGVECEYPPRKPNAFVPLESAAAISDDVAYPAPAENGLSTANIALDEAWDSTSGLDLCALDTPPSCSHPATTIDPSSSAWFLAPETWLIDRRPLPPPVRKPFDSAILKRFAATAYGWLVRWVDTGSNPFIHPRLYRGRFPDCVQVAYTVLATYAHKTPANTELVLRVVDDQAGKLLADNGVPFDDVDPGKDDDSVVEPLDALEHLARVHALLTYQTIALFDGDIRARHLAERRIPALTSWAAAMLSHAQAHLATQTLSFDSLAVTAVSPSSLTNPVDASERRWHAWILAESIRRTWLLAMGVQSVYFMLQQGWSACPGGIMYTTCAGVWDAGSAFQWERLCARVDVGFVQRFDTERFFTEANPEEVDEFGKMILEITFGVERVERWEAVVR